MSTLWYKYTCRSIEVVNGLDYCVYLMHTPSLPFADAGACFVCNTCPSDRDGSSDSSGGADCARRPKGEGFVACVETTAFTLLALLEAEDTESIVCLAQWLVRKWQFLFLTDIHVHDSSVASSFTGYELISEGVHAFCDVFFLCKLWLGSVRPPTAVSLTSQL